MTTSTKNLPTRSKADKPPTNIINGPNKHDLLLSLSEGKRVRFSFGSDECAVVVTTITSRNDIGSDSNDEWQLAGKILFDPKDPATSSYQTFIAFYHTETRKGMVMIG